MPIENMNLNRVLKLKLSYAHAIQAKYINLLIDYAIQFNNELGNSILGHVIIGRKYAMAWLKSIDQYDAIWWQTISPAYYEQLWQLHGPIMRKNTNDSLIIMLRNILIYVNQHPEEITKLKQYDFKHPIEHKSIQTYLSFAKNEEQALLNRLYQEEIK